MRPLQRLTLLLASLGALSGSAQTYKFRSVGTDQGLPQPFVHTISQDASGFLWLGTGNGLSRYDGKTVENFTVDNGLAENFIRSTFLDEQGKLWVGHGEGGISVRKRNRFERISPSMELHSAVNGFIGDGKGGVYAILQSDGILHITHDGRTALTPAPEYNLLYSICKVGGSRIIVGTNEGVHQYRIAPEQGLTYDGPVDGGPDVQVNSIQRSPSGEQVFLGTAGQGILVMDLLNEAFTVATPLRMPGITGLFIVKQMLFDPDGKLWVATFGEGVYELEIAGVNVQTMLNFHTGNGSLTNNISCLFIDREDNVWMGRFGIDAARLLDRSIVFYNAEEGSRLDIRSIHVDQKEAIMGSVGQIIRTDLNNDRLRDTLSKTNGLPDAPITAVIKDREGVVWAGTESEGLYFLDRKGHFERLLMHTGQLSQRILDLATRRNELWVATSNGAFMITKDTIMHYTTNDGLLHNQVNHIYVADGGDVWLACNNGGITRISSNGYHSFALAPTGEAFNVTGILVDETGAGWFSTYGNGLFRNKDGQFERWSSDNGLRSDFCYSMINDGKGSIWTGHAGGLSRVDIRSGTVRKYARDHGIDQDCRNNAAVADTRGNVWFGTNGGAVRYDPDRDERVEVPPPINMVKIEVADKPFDLNTPIQLPAGAYKIRFAFKGISLKDPDMVSYQYLLEGHDLEWSDPSSEGSATYSRVEHGNYIFRIRACNSDGACQEIAYRQKISIASPIWQRWWFIALAAIILLAGVRAFIAIREANARRQRELLQQKLDERTEELRANQVEIERKNKDITDSITYARRIQQAILQSEAELQQQFPESFIFHRPRDIVSGDFYWFKRFQDKLVLACADCTGHGVPGAFMSMIGSMLMRELTMMQEVDAPNKLLMYLDNQVRSILHGHNGTEHSVDGMDVSVCEIDLNTRVIRCSGAMQDILLYKDGQLQRLKGDRHSIGGFRSNGAAHKYGLHGHQLSMGDRIYFFSDGVPDQFGGAHGKKLKLRGLQELVASIAAIPMEEQAAAFNDRFSAWMDGYEQVDDILFMGVEV